jgi:hypothetical protein
LKKALTILAVAVLLCSLCLTLTPKNVYSKTQDIKIVSYSYYIDNLGYLDVVGEIQNTGSETIQNILLTGIAYGTNGQQASNGTYNPYVYYLAPQQKAPFLLDLRTPTSSDWTSVGISKVTVSVSTADAVSDNLYSDFSISVNSAGVSQSTSDKGTYWISGSVKNTGSQTASKLVIAAAFYNSSGAVIAVGYTDYLTPNDVNPQSTDSFKVGAFDTNQSAEVSNRQITSYSLILQATTTDGHGSATYGQSTTGPTQTDTSTTSTSSTTPSQQDNNSSNQNLIYALIIVGVVVAIVAALLVSRRGRASPETVETKKKQIKKR